VSEVLRDEAAVLDALVDEVLEGRGAIELARLRALAPALRRLVVQRLADEAAGRPAPGTARRADELAAMAPSAMLDLPHGVRAVAERGVLRFESHTTGARRGASRMTRAGRSASQDGEQAKRPRRP
jgi:tRNA(Ile)-lysidine synthase